MCAATLSPAQPGQTAYHAFMTTITLGFDSCSPVEATNNQ